MFRFFYKKYSAFIRI